MERPDSLPQNGTFTDKVMIGLKKALRKLAEEAALNNENLVIGDKDGNAKSVPAKDLLKTLSK
jgi:DNA-binding Xre family transcriptional regulator